MREEIKQRIEQIRRVEVPEGYKKTKVGLVPEEWEIKKLSDISDEIKEVAGTGKYETLSISAGIGFVNQANKFGKELSGKQYEKYTVLRKGDFAYNKGNSKKYPQGCVYRLKDRDSAAVPNVFECFRIKEGNKNYIEQVFISGFLNRQLSKKINHGVRDDGLLNLTGEDFYKSYIIIPPLQEQEKIAAILQTQDKVIELQQKKIDELKKLKKVYLSKMFPQKGCNVPEIRFPGFTDPWEQRKLSEVADKVTEKNADLTVQETFTNSAEFGVISQRDFFDHDISNADNIGGYYVVRNEDFVYNPRISVTAPVGPVNRNKLGRNGVMSPLYTVFRTHDIDTTYLECFFKSNYWHPFMFFNGDSGARSDRFSIKDAVFFKMPIPVPDLEEQHQIGSYLDMLDNLITLHQRKLDEEQKKKKALMQLLLTGIVRT